MARNLIRKNLKTNTTSIDIVFRVCVKNTLRNSNVKRRQHLKGIRC